MKDIKFVPVAPKTYEVKYVESKRSSLSPAARSKVINCSGSNYVSGRITAINPGFGPMPDNSSNSFSLTITISSGDNDCKPAFEASGATFSTCTFNDVSKAVLWMAKLGDEVKVVNTKNNNERDTRLEEWVKESMREDIASFMVADLKEGESWSHRILLTGNS